VGMLSLLKKIVVVVVVRVVVVGGHVVAFKKDFSIFNHFKLDKY